ncbi:MAG: hypothetical protein ACK55Z_08725, partial [bacterium]
MSSPHPSPFFKWAADCIDERVYTFERAKVDTLKLAFFLQLHLERFNGRSLAATGWTRCRLASGCRPPDACERRARVSAKRWQRKAARAAACAASARPADARHSREIG